MGSRRGTRDEVRHPAGASVMLPRSHQGSFRDRRRRRRNDMMTSVHPDKLPSGVLEKLSRANHALTARYPGEPATRQPVHVVYGGAHLFKANTVQRMGQLALSAVREY